MSPFKVFSIQFQIVTPREGEGLAAIRKPLREALVVAPTDSAVAGVIEKNLALEPGQRVDVVQLKPLEARKEVFL